MSKIPLKQRPSLKKFTGEAFKSVDVKKDYVIVQGYLSHFGSVDSDGDVIQKGAYSKTIKENGPQGKNLIAFLLDHDTKIATGGFEELKEDNIGLFYRGFVKNYHGIDVVGLVRDGVIKQHSVRIVQVNALNTKGENNSNIMTEVMLYEGSLIQFRGANVNTPITSVKSEKDLQAQLEILTKALKTGTYTDVTFTNIVIPQIKEIETILADRKKSLKPSNDDLGELIKSSFNKITF